MRKRPFASWVMSTASELILVGCCGLHLWLFCSILVKRQYMYSTVKYRLVLFGTGKILSCLCNVITRVIFQRVCTINVYYHTKWCTWNITKLILKLKLFRHVSVLIHHHILYNIIFISTLHIHYRFQLYMRPHLPTILPWRHTDVLYFNNP
jgi:hypothetical protein